MADQKLEALILQLDATRILLQRNAADQAQKDNIGTVYKQMILDLREEHRQAVASNQEAAFFSKVEGAAKGFQQMAGASVALANAVHSGDPFAISASSLDLAASVVSTISLAGGPIGAAIGAVAGAILSIVSMILKLFQKESESLISQIEKILLKIDSEHQLIDLWAARDEITAFTQLAMTRNIRNVNRMEARIKTLKALEESGDVAFARGDIGSVVGTQVLEAKLEPVGPPESYTFEAIDGELKLEMKSLLGPKNWLEIQDHKELPLWSEVLYTLCQVYASFKLAVAAWLPLAKPESVEQLLDWRGKYDQIMLDFLERIKLTARNRGIICHIGTNKDVFVRDVVIAGTIPWQEIAGTSAHAIAATYRAGWETSLNPFLSIFHLGGEEKKESWAWVKTLAYDLDGSWPLSKGLEWTKLGQIGEAYDIWAIPGTSPGEIDVFTAEKGYIKRYREKGDDKHMELIEAHPTDGMKAVNVRAVRPKSLPKDNEKGWHLAVYELCAVGDEKPPFSSNPFKIWAFFLTPERESVDGTILLPYHDSREMRDFPQGIAVDSVRIWVFNTTWIACATHANVKEHLEKKQPILDWTLYDIPKKGLGKLFDLSACDDGTLTAVIREDNARLPPGRGRIFTATPRFPEGKLIIEREVQDLKFGTISTTHGWVRESQDTTVALRVHKLPIFCWSSIESLQASLKK